MNKAGLQRILRIASFYDSKGAYEIADTIARAMIKISHYDDEEYYSDLPPVDMEDAPTMEELERADDERRLLELLAIPKDHKTLEDIEDERALWARMHGEQYSVDPETARLQKALGSGVLDYMQ